MTAIHRLGDIAHARAGDKGDSSIIVLAPYDPADYDAVNAAVSPDRLAEHFHVDASTILVRSVPALSAFSLVIPHRLDGGVTRSASADPHGKTLSAHLLELPLARLDQPCSKPPFAPESERSQLR
ncbi:hypothetical protein [Leifsonia shinshuensis]|uniref:AtuA-related protein n=1 Tax=Leifsonia shinshuensis TaxID=150026 RepID=UPI002862183C|nr:hypothetical protein [Leifsonia shinshuensis]MDR6972878.1 hypothetical protein [Leifsonia shinshuensis]